MTTPTPTTTTGMAEWRNGGMGEWQEWRNGRNGGNGGSGNGGRNGRMAGMEWLNGTHKWLRTYYLRYTPPNGTNGYIHTIYGTHRRGRRHQRHFNLL